MIYSGVDGSDTSDAFSARILQMTVKAGGGCYKGFFRHFPTQVCFEGFYFNSLLIKIISSHNAVLEDLGYDSCKHYVIKTSCSIAIVRCWQQV
jgi:hypothetical protein